MMSKRSDIPKQSRVGPRYDDTSPERILGVRTVVDLSRRRTDGIAFVLLLLRKPANRGLAPERSARDNDL